MKKLFISVVVLVLSVFMLSSCGTKEINLQDMKKGHVYTYLGIPWMSSAEEVEKALGYSLGEPHIAEEKTGTVHIYEPEEEVNILGKKPKTSVFQFTNEGLVNVLIVFEGDDFFAFYDQLVEECKETFGEDDLVTSSKIRENNQWTDDSATWEFNKIEDDKVITTGVEVLRITDDQGKLVQLLLSVGCFTPLENVEKE